MSTDDCGNDLAAFIGRNPGIDHKIGSFWCAAEQYYNFFNNAQKERCIGPRNAHSYMLDYTLEFSQNYKDVSRFSYIHLNTAHEGSGTVIATLDQDLEQFLAEVLTQQDVKVILMGDHGMRYGNWFTQIDGSHEHRLPALFFIWPKAALTDQMRSALHHNTLRLVAKIDLHATLIDMIYEPKDSLALLCLTSLQNRPVSLIREQIPDSRKCSDVGIPSFWCSCLSFEEIEVGALESLVVHLADEVLVQLNEVVYTPKNYQMGAVCKKLTLGKLIKVEHQGTETENYYRLRFFTQQSTTVAFEALVLLSRTKLKTRYRDGFGSKAFYFEGRQTFKLMYVKRLDAYAGLCKDLSLSVGLEPMYCVCDSIDRVNYKDSKAVDSLLSHYNNELTVEQDCDLGCSR